jgi:hypothetical protein
MRSQGYHNVRMLLFRPFVSYYAQSATSSLDSLRDSVDKCIESARRTIEIIHEMYRIHSFFRTWYVCQSEIRIRTGTKFIGGITPRM